jgi:hypothetical protein
MAITRFEGLKKEWDAGEVHEVNGLGHDFNEQQYWLREARLPLVSCCSHARTQVVPKVSKYSGLCLSIEYRYLKECSMRRNTTDYG